MSKIITFANQKGGTGKTTLSVLVANTLASDFFNYSVTVVDCDQQQSISRSRLFDLEDHKGAIPYDVKTWNIPTLQKRISKLDQENDFIIIDLPGRMGKDIETILAYVDFCFVPITPGNYALESSLSFLDYIGKLSANRKNPLVSYGLMNRYLAGRRNSSFLNSEANQVNQVYGVPFFRSKLKAYVAYEDTDTINTLYNPEATDAVGINFLKFFNELHKILSND